MVADIRLKFVVIFDPRTSEEILRLDFSEDKSTCVIVRQAIEKVVVSRSQSDVPSSSLVSYANSILSLLDHEGRVCFELESDDTDGPVLAEKIVSILDYAKEEFRASTNAFKISQFLKYGRPQF